ncbi:hypothetical protein GCM10007190_16340 [Macrococcus hajekii]|uniref:TSUP family transporter n=1 Tax=Macrococcus hajekii TaxID=198482 RepID=UPI0019A0108F|nr:TSUP family transporter [Macrococcus hajekii]GGB09018.1 hypothetical protein GCM10007190_16340 [Macrococcus hajekii]
MNYFIYFIIILFANTIGAISGMGGGVIIKPSLDALKIHPLDAINFYSAAAVFTMSIVSLYKQYKSGFTTKLNKLVTIAAGSILGGIGGQSLFSYLLFFFHRQLKSS